MVDQTKKSYLGILFLGLILIAIIGTLYVLSIYKLIPNSLIEASDLISVISSSILSLAIFSVYIYIYMVQKDQRDINEDMRDFQERQTRIIESQNDIIDRQNEIMEGQEELTLLNYKPILSASIVKIENGEISLNLSNKGRGRAIEPHIRLDLDIDGTHSSQQLLTREVDHSDDDRHPGRGKEIDERFLNPIFCRIEASDTDSTISNKYDMNLVLEPGDSGEVKAPVKMELEDADMNFSSHVKFEKWGKYLKSIKDKNTEINWRVFLVYRDEADNVYCVNLLEGRLYRDHSMHVTGNEEDSFLYEEEGEPYPVNVAEIYSTLSDLAFRRGIVKSMNIDSKQIKEEYIEHLNDAYNYSID